MRLKSFLISISLQAIAFSTIFLGFNHPIFAADYQKCTVSTNCVIGEFLYDDTYLPDATASCTLTSRNPDGTLFLNSVAMTASSSGWYSYTAALGTTQGVYPSQICCTTTSDYLCLDKTFSVEAGPITTSDIWGYSTRSLTSFGTLVADIWNNSTRSLTTFNSLVTDIWSRDTRTITGGSDATTLAEIRETKRVANENRVLLEQLVNKPIVKTFIDNNPLPNLSEKINKTNTASANLYSGVQNLKSRGQLLSKKWPSLTETEIKSELESLLSILKQDINQPETNILATTNWLKSSWNNPILLSLSDQAQAIQSSLNNLLNDINLFGKGTNDDVFSPALSHIEKLDELVGSSLASSEDLNLFGFIKKINNQVAFFDKQSSEGLKLLTEIKKDLIKDQSVNIAQFQNQVIASNQLPKVDSMVVSSLNKELTPTNRVLALLAIIDTNKLLLAANTGQTVENIWLEEGSIIFRSVAINPSHTLTQKVTVKYYLPTELKKEQIINIDPGLVIDFDPIENALFASGEVTLAPNETQTFLVEVEDIWSFKQEEIDSLKNQVNELVKLLKNTPNYAQAATIKSDVFVTLDKIMLRQGEAITPENRIRTYRESALEMNGVEQKINSLKELTLTSGTTVNFFGSFGGIQAITLWGIILIAITGFIFLIIYLNALRTDSHLTIEEKDNKSEDKGNLYHPTFKYRHREIKPHPSHRIVRIASVVLITSSIGSLGASAVIKPFQDHSQVLISPIPGATVLGTTAEKQLKYPYQSKLIISGTGKIPVRNAPSLSSPEILSLSPEQNVYVFKTVDSWAQIGLFDKDQDKGWWINTQYLEIK